MKKVKQAKVFLFIFLLLATVSSQAQVGIGTTTPAASAQLDVSSTSKGLLPPRMTKVQRDAITTPVPGLMIWCNNCVAPSGELQVFNGTSWTNMTGGTSPSAPPWWPWPTFLILLTMIGCSFLASPAITSYL